MTTTCTNLEILVASRQQVECDTDYGHFALINEGTPEPSLMKDDDLDPVTFDGEIEEPWNEDPEQLEDIQNIYQFLLNALNL